jgi:hypothetical protein
MYDETRWMAVVIELIAVVGAIGFAVVQAYR